MRIMGLDFGSKTVGVAISDELLITAQGALEIQGEGLHIEKLSLDGGDLRVEGRVNALLYEADGGSRGGGFLSRLLGG